MHNLIDDVRFIPVTGVDSADVTDMTLRECISNADTTISTIAAPTPMQTIGLLRLLSAITIRAGVTPKTGWDPKRIMNYLDHWHDKFDLTDTTHPFMQSPSLIARYPKPNPASIIDPMKSTGDNRTVFDHTTTDDTVIYTPSQAVRLLIAYHASSTGGLKSSASGRGVSPSFRAPIAVRAVTWITKPTLAESILANVTGAVTNQDDVPVWELTQPLSPEPRKDNVPAGTAQWFTWQSRRVALWFNGNGDIDGAIACPGDSEPSDWQPALVDPTLPRYIDHIGKNLTPIDETARDILNAWTPDYDPVTAITALLKGDRPIPAPTDALDGLNAITSAKYDISKTDNDSTDAFVKKATAINKRITQLSASRATSNTVTTMMEHDGLTTPGPALRLYTANHPDTMVTVITFRQLTNQSSYLQQRTDWFTISIPEQSTMTPIRTPVDSIPTLF